MKVLLYTFRSFPWVRELKKLDIELFVFGKLKEDLPKFLELVHNTKPDFIVGVAKSSKTSRFETRAVNIFNNTKKISKDGRGHYLLDYPSGGFQNIKVNNSNTHSFCNWTMYKIAESTKIKQQFVHIAEIDLDVFKSYLTNCL